MTGFLREARQLKLLLCFDALVVESVPFTGLDVKSDLVITQSGVKRIGKVGVQDEP